MPPIALARTPTSTFPEPANDCTVRSSPLRILLAEDNEAMRRLVGFVLRSDGHELTEARDGAELLEALAASIKDGARAQLDAIISEHTLPGLDGLAVLAGLRARGLATPFVLITADVIVQQRARRLGAVVLDQPFDTRAIRAAVTEASAGPPTIG